MFIPPALFVCISFFLVVRSVVQMMIHNCREKKRKKNTRQQQIIAADGLGEIAVEPDSPEVNPLLQHVAHSESLGGSVITIGLFLAFVSYFELVEKVMSG